MSGKFNYLLSGNPYLAFAEHAKFGLGQQSNLFIQARLLQYQHPAYGTVLPPSGGSSLAHILPTSAGASTSNPDQQPQQQDQGWRLPQYRPMLRKEDQAVPRREGLPWTGLPPQIGQDRWLPPSAHHQVDLVK